MGEGWGEGKLEQEQPPMSQHLAHMSVQQLKGVGTMLADKLAKLGLYTLQDVLFHLPRDYEIAHLVRCISPIWLTYRRASCPRL